VIWLATSARSASEIRIADPPARPGPAQLGPAHPPRLPPAICGPPETGIFSYLGFQRARERDCRDCMKSLAIDCVAPSSGISSQQAR